MHSENSFPDGESCEFELGTEISDRINPILIGFRIGFSMRFIKISDREISDQNVSAFRTGFRTFDVADDRRLRDARKKRYSA